MKLSELTAALTNGGIENARHEARLMFAHFGYFPPASLVGCDPDLDTPALKEALVRRLRREPLQYILGEVAFYNETYRVTPDCLIPRADTELLVEWAVTLLPRGARFADLCTGSGCIAISTLASRTDTTADAYDISEGALRLAEENAVRNGVKERFHICQCDLLTTPLDGIYDALLSNPPYIVRDVVDTLAPEVQFEPRIALDGGKDGMNFYRALLTNNLAHLVPYGYVLFEIGYDQAETITCLAKAHHMTCRIKRDLGGNPRLAILQKQD